VSMPRVLTVRPGVQRRQTYASYAKAFRLDQSGRVPSMLRDGISPESRKTGVAEATAALRYDEPSRSLTRPATRAATARQAVSPGESMPAA
jgi:hypothetical protein